MRVKRIFISAPDAGDANMKVRQPIDLASWIWSDDPSAKFLLFKKEFASDGSLLTLHVSADERFELRVDGSRIARGPHRGDLNHWPCSSFELELPPGRHELSALVWRLGPDDSPAAQFSWRGGFILKAEGEFYDDALTTGVAPWLVAKAGGWRTLPVGAPRVFGVGSAFEWSGGAKAVEPFQKAQVVKKPIERTWWGSPDPGWKLEPSPLPEMRSCELRAGVPRACGRGLPDASFKFSGECLESSERLAAWGRFLRGESPIAVPACAEEFVLIDLQDYFTGYPLLELSGGAGSLVKISWAEALFDKLEPEMAKSCRDDVEGKLFKGIEDVFPVSGEDASLSVPWWRAGRYLLVSVRTSVEPLVLRKLAIEETGYPFEPSASFSADCPDLPEIWRICVRALRSCAHETFMDCPYYEQLMYVGDTRLEMLTMDVLCADERLVKRCVELFDFSRVNWGFVNERYPSWRAQHSPTFSMIWALMLRDFLLWRAPERPWIADRLVGLRSMLEQFEPYVNGDGLLERLPGWPFMDWATGWKVGTPPGGYDGVSSVVNLLYVCSLQAAAGIEDMAGEPLLAGRLRGKAERVKKAVVKLYWSEERGMIADDAAKTMFSEHAQALALLCDAVEGSAASALLARLLSEKGLVKASSYFVFYVFEAFKKAGRAELILDKLDVWREMLKLGFKTTPEEPRAGTRSDCHAWSAQILFHLFASVAGIRPASPSFKTVRIEPRLGALKRLDVKTPHPAGGEIALSVRDGVCSVSLPEGVSGSLLWNGREVALPAGARTEAR